MAEGEEEMIVAGAGDDEEKNIVLVEAGGHEEKSIVPVGAGGDEELRIVPVGAGGDEELKKIVLVGEGNEGVMMRNAEQIFPPPGFRFRPELDELVMYYLLPKLQGREHVPNRNIIEDNVYQCHPDKLIDKYKDRGEDSWYFLSPRARKYTNGNRPSRSTDDKRGRWKASTGKKKVDDEVDGGGKTTKSSPATAIKVAGDGKTVYTKSTLAYFTGPIKGEKKSKWLMKELTIPGYEKKRDKNGGGGGGKDTLDQYVMCRIYVTGRHKGDDDEAGPSGAKSEPAESGQGTTDGRVKLSEKQAGKRPAEEQPAAATASKRARHPNPDRLNLGPPAPLHGNGMRAPFMPPGYCGGGPGRPMGNYARPPRPPVMYHNGQGPVASNGQTHVPRQPVACNGHGPRPPMMHHNGQGPVSSNGQAQVPRQPVACNGHGPRPPVMYHNGQTPVASNGQAQVPRQPVACGQGQLPRQQAAYNSQVPMQRHTVGFNVQVPVPRQQVAYDGKVMRQPVLKFSPPYRPAGTLSPSGQNQTMMPRPPYPAGQAVNPPSSGVPRPAQTETQPETAEMRAKRVIDQNLEEYMRMQMMQSSTRPPASAGHAAPAQQQRPTALTHQQQQRPMMPFTQRQQRPMMALTQQQQRPYLGPNAYNHHHAGAMAPRLSLDNFNASEAAQHYERSRVVLPATSGSAGASAGCLVSSVVPGAGGAVSGANRDCSNDDNQVPDDNNMEFVEPATEGGNASAADGDGPNMIQHSDRLPI